MAKHRAGRSRLPLPPLNISHSPAVSDEQAAARTLQAERDRRAGECLVELLALLRRHRCGLQAVIQDIMIPGQPGFQRVCAVNVVPLDTAELPTPAPAGSRDNGGKPGP